MSNTNSTFGMFVPIEITKAKKAGSDTEEEMIFEGIASTDSKDQEGEILLPSGFDLSYLLNQGYINWHHRQKDKPSAIIGEPITAKVVGNGSKLFLRSKLYNTPLAKEVYDFGVTLKNQSKTRRLGYSIEGTAIERDPTDPRIITKAKITGCAITYQPVNQYTTADVILKAIDDASKEDLLEALQESGMEGTEILKACAFDEIKKDVSADLDEQNFDSDDEKDKKKDDEDEEDIEKDLTTDSGRPLIPESLDGLKEDLKQEDDEINKAINNFLVNSGIELDEQSFKNFKQFVNMSNATVISEQDIQKALDLIEKAKDFNFEKAKNNYEKAEQPDDDDDDEDEDGNEEEIQKGGFTEQDIQKSVKTLSDNFGASFGAVQLIIKSFNDDLKALKSENDILKAKVEELTNAPVGRKSIASARPIEKSFEGDLGGGNQPQTTTLSIRNNKQQICGKLEQFAFPIENGIAGFNDNFAKALTTFESSSHLEPFALAALRKSGVEITN